MPPSLCDWLPEDHLAWFVIDVVGRLGLQPFYAAYRADGHGRAAYEPSVMVSLVLFACSTDERSSRGIERRCRQDIAYRVIIGNQVPDHATIARFIRRHQQSLDGLFGAVLRLCARAGLVSSGVVAVDGTKLTASASSDSNVDYDRIAREIIAEAIATDEAEDEQHGDARGDELPPELQTEAGRREWLERELAREQTEGETAPAECVEEALGEFDPSGSDELGDAAGCGKRSATLSPDAGRLRSRSRILGLSACGSAPGSWRTGWLRIAAATGPMRTFASIVGCMTSASSVVRRSPTRRLRFQPAR